MVAVERSFAEPVSFEAIQETEDRAGSCLQAYGVRFLRSYFSRDQKRMICLYEAPDAESVRLAQEKAGLPFERAWAARALRYDGPEPQGDAVVVERILARPVDEAGLRESVARGGWCLEQYGCRIVWSYLSPDSRRCLCVFAAPDAETVRQIQHRMDMPYERAWPATLHEPAPAT